MQLTDKQKKWLWIGGGVLVFIHFMPDFVNMVRQQIAVYRFEHAKPAVATRTATPLPALPAPVALKPESQSDAKLAQLVGIWGGTLPVPGVGFCGIRLELNAGEEKSSFTGYSTMSCANVLRFRPGQRTNPQNATKALIDATPVSAILTGDIEKGSIELHQTQAFGADSRGCNIVGVSITSFAELMGMTWKEGPANWKDNPDSGCAGGQVIMHRMPR